jgi:hypothetical protein
MTALTDAVYGPPVPESTRTTYKGIVPPIGGKPVSYRRATAFIKALEDSYVLNMWGRRSTAKGLALRPDLLARVHTLDVREDRTELNALCQKAIDAAGGDAPANMGTALHGLTALVDSGQPLPNGLSASLIADIDAYQRARDAARLVPVLVERFVVFDSFRVGGTFDRLYTVDNTTAHVIGDVKTGRDVTYGTHSYAMQLAIYNHGVLYTTEPEPDADGARRQPLPGKVDKNRGLIVHLPAGKAECHFYIVDTEAGWNAVTLAHAVWNWRARKDLMTPAFIDRAQEIEDVFEAIARANTVDELKAVYRDHREHWTDEHNDLAKAKRSLIEAGIAFYPLGEDTT